MNASRGNILGYMRLKRRRRDDPRQSLSRCTFVYLVLEDDRNSEAHRDAQLARPELESVSNVVMRLVPKQVMKARKLGYMHLAFLDY